MNTKRIQTEIFKALMSRQRVTFANINALGLDKPRVYACGAMLSGWVLDASDVCFDPCKCYEAPMLARMAQDQPGDVQIIATPEIRAYGTKDFVRRYEHGAGGGPAVWLLESLYDKIVAPCEASFFFDGKRVQLRNKNGDPLGFVIPTKI